VGEEKSTQFDLILCPNRALAQTHLCLLRSFSNTLISLLLLLDAFLIPSALSTDFKSLESVTVTSLMSACIQVLIYIPRPFS
jgi:hypothetical protein